MPLIHCLLFASYVCVGARVATAGARGAGKNGLRKVVLFVGCFTSQATMLVYLRDVADIITIMRHN